MKELTTNKLHIPRGLTVSKALASTTPITLIARHTYCPWSLVEARTTLKVPDGSKIWRSSEGSLPPFLVQAISGTGWPLARHWSSAVLPSNTSVFWGERIILGGPERRAETKQWHCWPSNPQIYGLRRKMPLKPSLEELDCSFQE